MSFFTLVYLWCGRTVGRSVYSHVITKFSRMGSLPHFLTHGVRYARFARESSAVIVLGFLEIQSNNVPVDAKPYQDVF